MSFLLRTTVKSLLTTRAFTATSRIMAPKQEWMVILPDYADKLAERNKVRTYEMPKYLTGGVQPYRRLN